MLRQTSSETNHSGKSNLNPTGTSTRSTIWKTKMDKTISSLQRSSFKCRAIVDSQGNIDSSRLSFKCRAMWIPKATLIAQGYYEGNNYIWVPRRADYTKAKLPKFTSKKKLQKNMPPRSQKRAYKPKDSMRKVWVPKEPCSKSSIPPTLASQGNSKKTKCSLSQQLSSNSKSMLQRAFGSQRSKAM